MSAVLSLSGAIGAPDVQDPPVKGSVVSGVGGGGRVVGEVPPVSAGSGAGGGMTPRGSCGTEEITQSNNPGAIGPDSVWCGDLQTSAETSMARAFVAPSTLDLRCVTFGVRQNLGGPWNARVRILQGSVATPYPELTLLRETQVSIPGGTSFAFFTAMFDGLVLPAGTDFIVELNSPSRVPADGGDGGLLNFGCNTQGQTAPTYFRAPSCGLPNFVTLQSIGFGSRCLVMTLGVASAIGSVCCYFDEHSLQIVCDDSLTQAACEALTGATWVPVTACSQDPCQSRVGACCFADASCNIAGCVITSVSECATRYPNSTFHPGVTDCASLGASCHASPPATGRSCAPSQTGLRFYWPLDETSGTTAHDLAGFNHGTYNGAPLPSAGAVGGSLEFNGFNSVVAGPAGAAFYTSIATKGMSTDAWIYTTGTGAGFDGVILGSQPIPGTRSGFEFGISCDSLSFALVDDSGGFYWVTSVCKIPRRTWTHVGAWMLPGSPPAIALFVNGVNVATTAVGSSSAGITGDGPLTIGGFTSLTFGSCSTGTPGFMGRIDSVTLHDRAVQWWSFSTIYEAGSAGYCIESCHSTWEASCSQGARPCVSLPASNAEAEFQICNLSSTTYTYNATIVPANSAPFPAPSCSPPPSGFTPVFSPSSFSGLTLAGGSCVVNNFCVQCPAPVPSGHYGCWEVMVTNTTTGAVRRCSGSTVAHGTVLFKRGLEDALVEGDVGLFTTLAFDVTNVADASGVIDYRIIVMPSDMPPSENTPESPVALNGLPPGEPVLGSIAVPVGGMGVVSFDVEFLSSNPFRFFDAIIMADVDGDGDMEPAASIALRVLPGSPPPACRADFNADGIVNSQDFFDFLLAFFGGSADFNGDGVTNSQDFFDFLVVFFNGC